MSCSAALYVLQCWWGCCFHNAAAQAPQLALQDWLSEAELGQTLTSYDADGSGDINFDEFVHMVRQQSARCSSFTNLQGEPMSCCAELAGNLQQQQQFDTLTLD